MIDQDQDNQSIVQSFVSMLEYSNKTELETLLDHTMTKYKDRDTLAYEQRHYRQMAKLIRTQIKRY